MSLSNIIEEIKKVKPLADEDVSSGPTETLSARRGRKNQAIDKMKQLRRTYIQELMKSAIFIVTTGSGRDEFSTLSKDFSCFTADPEEFYNDLSGRVPQSLYINKPGVSNIFDVLGRHLEDKMGEMDITEYNQLLFKAEFARVIQEPKEFTALVKQAINKQIGAEVAGIQAVRSIADEAIEKGHAKSKTPIVLTTGDDQLALDLIKDLSRLTSRVFLVTVGKSSKAMKSVEDVISIKEATKESVEETLSTINKNLKK